MTNYSERSLQLAAQLRQQALRNLAQSKKAETDRGRAKTADGIRQPRED